MPTVAAVVIFNVLGNNELLQAILQSTSNHLVFHGNKKSERTVIKSSTTIVEKNDQEDRNPSNGLKHTQC